MLSYPFFLSFSHCHFCASNEAEDHHIFILPPGQLRSDATRTQTAHINGIIVSLCAFCELHDGTKRIAVANDTQYLALKTVAGQPREVRRALSANKSTQLFKANANNTANCSTLCLVQVQFDVRFRKLCDVNFFFLKCYM